MNRADGWNRWRLKEEEGEFERKNGTEFDYLNRYFLFEIDFARKKADKVKKIKNRRGVLNG